MSEIDLSEVVDDSMLADPYTIKRSTGTFQLGGWVTTPINLVGWGIVGVASEQDMEMLPEGDRVTGAMVFHSTQQLYETQFEGGAGQQAFGQGGFGNGAQRVSDQIWWRGQLYRILHVAPQDHRGYWKAIGARITGR